MMPNGVYSSPDSRGYGQSNNQETSYGDREGVVHHHHVTDDFSFGVSSGQAFQPFLPLGSNEGLLNYNASAATCQRVVGGIDKNFDGGSGKEVIIWHRTKWTDEMVKVLITAVSYVGEDDSSFCSSSDRKKLLLCPKKGKWRVISDVMVDRGYYVSPQQCEDKFNDLNKKYKRLNVILGRGIACDVVENPLLVESMDLKDEAKAEVKKLLSCKQLFYQEMCSYNNGNRLYLPDHPVLQLSLLFALKRKVDCESERLVQGTPTKRTKLREEREGSRLASTSSCRGFDSSSGFHAPIDHTKPVDITSGGEAEKLQVETLMSRSLKLEEKKLKLQLQMLELEEERFEWLRYSHQKETELQKMRLRIEFMKLENDRLAFELKSRAKNGDSWTGKSVRGNEN